MSFKWLCWILPGLVFCHYTDLPGFQGSCQPLFIGTHRHLNTKLHDKPQRAKVLLYFKLFQCKKRYFCENGSLLGNSFQVLPSNHLTLLYHSSLSLTPNFSYTHIASLLEINNALSVAINHELPSGKFYCLVDSGLKSFYHLWLTYIKLYASFMYFKMFGVFKHQEM